MTKKVRIIAPTDDPSIHHNVSPHVTPFAKRGFMQNTNLVSIKGSNVNESGCISVAGNWRNAKSLMNTSKTFVKSVDVDENDQTLMMVYILFIDLHY